MSDDRLDRLDRDLVNGWRDEFRGLIDGAIDQRHPLDGAGEVRVRELQRLVALAADDPGVLVEFETIVVAAVARLDGPTDRRR